MQAFHGVCKIFAQKQLARNELATGCAGISFTLVQLHGEWGCYLGDGVVEVASYALQHAFELACGHPAARAPSMAPLPALVAPLGLINLLESHRPVDTAGR